MAAAGPADTAIARALAAWMRRLADGSPRTAQSYKREAKAFAAFLAAIYGPGLGVFIQAQPSDCMAFVHAVPGLAASSRAVKAAVLRGLFGVLVVEGLRASNPAADIHIRRVVSGRHHPAVPQSAIITTLEHLRQSDECRDIRDRALLLLALAVGARRFELAALNVSNIQREADGRAFLSLQGKGRKAARMTIKPGVVAALDRWLAVGGHGQNPAAPLFHNLSHRPEHAGKRLTGGGIRAIVKAHFPRHSPHGLRARSITDVWSQSGANLGHAQTFARHSSPAVTERVYIQAEKLGHALEFVYDYA
jgi:site-specific recombinase XerC